jgi:hypothetical protein
VAAFACLDVRAINSHRPKTPWWPFSKEKKKKKRKPNLRGEGKRQPSANPPRAIEILRLIKVKP